MKIVRQDASLPKIIAVGVGIFLVSIFLLYLLASSWFYTKQKERFVSGVMIDNQNVGGLTLDQAQLLLQQNDHFENLTVELSSDSQTLASSSAELGLEKQYEKILPIAFQLGRGSNRVSALVAYLQYRFSPDFSTSLYTPLQFNTGKLYEFSTVFAQQVDQEIAFPSATKKTNTEVEIFIGKTGQVVDVNKTVEKIQALASSESIKTEAVLLTTGAELSESEVVEAQERAKKYLGKSLTFNIDRQQFTLFDTELIELLGFPLGFHEEHVRERLTSWEEQVKRPGQNAEFIYDPTTLKVEKFQPQRDGWTLDIITTQTLLLDALTKLERGEQMAEMHLSLITSAPDITLENSNTLGIKERIGFGESYYDHSIPTRIHNVSRASEILNNTIVPPGEEFSFNNYLGDVTQATGFKPAYIIQAGRTVLGDGGGVCQVSTTLFRALLDSGLDITKRRQHSYRVSYYELDRQPGFDAAVFSGETDLRFVNDSPNHVLLHFVTNPETKYMFVEIYGTSDGRTTEVTEYEKWGARGAPESVYQDDPTLPAGKIIQVDWAVGGIKAKFKHITRDKEGNVIREKEYFSNYVPWSAKYRRGTGV